MVLFEFPYEYKSPKVASEFLGQLFITLKVAAKLCYITLRDALYIFFGLHSLFVYISFYLIPSYLTHIPLYFRLYDNGEIPTLNGCSPNKDSTQRKSTGIEREDGHDVKLVNSNTSYKLDERS
jgi:hypothetical protein